MKVHFSQLICEDSQHVVNTKALQELSEHIRVHGSLFPMRVTVDNGKFKVVRGCANRFKAIEMLGPEHWNNIEIKVQ